MQGGGVRRLPDRGGPYAEFFPLVLDAARDRSYVDYGFHLAPMMRRARGVVS